MQSFNKLNIKILRYKYMDFLKTIVHDTDSVLVNKPGYHKTKPLTLFWDVSTKGYFSQML